MILLPESEVRYVFLLRSEVQTSYEGWTAHLQQNLQYLLPMSVGFQNTTKISYITIQNFLFR